MKNSHYYAVVRLSDTSYIANIFAERSERDGYLRSLRSRRPDMHPAAWSERHIKEIASDPRNLVQGIVRTEDVPAWIRETGNVDPYEDGTCLYGINAYPTRR